MYIDDVFRFINVIIILRIFLVRQASLKNEMKIMIEDVTMNYEYEKSLSFMIAHDYCDNTSCILTYFDHDLIMII